jgi:hypothetical protein
MEEEEMEKVMERTASESETKIATETEDASDLVPDHDQDLDQGNYSCISIFYIIDLFVYAIAIVIAEESGKRNQHGNHGKESLQTSMFDHL